MMNSGRHFGWWLLGLGLFEGLSWLAFSASDLGKGPASVIGLLFFATIVVAVWLAWRRPFWLAWVTLAELIIGGKGYLLFVELSGQKISIRFVLFGVLLLAWGIRLLRQPDWRLSRNFWPPIILLLWVFVMSIVGWIRGYSMGAVFTDMNGYLYLGILGPWWYFFRRDSLWRDRVFIILLVGATYVGIKSWLMQLLFAQDAVWVPELYRWIRQTGIGEITLISKNVYRIFFQSQIYTLLAFVMTLAGFLLQRSRPWWGWAFLASSLGVYLSLSRSLWLGLGIAAICCIAALIRRREWHHLTRLWIVAPVTLFVWLMTSLALNFPYVIPPPGQPSKADAVVARLKSAGSQQASTARANQIPPLFEAIARNPITGHGFGATVSYYSTDPRIKGTRTTSAFELGYLDMLLHIGLVGVGLLAWWIWSVLRRLWKQPGGWLWVLPTVGLVAVHLTSPYLNHPLGLGWLALITVVAYDNE